MGRYLAGLLSEALPGGAPLWGAPALRKILICGVQILMFFAWVRLVEKRGIVTLGFRCKHRAKAYRNGFLIGFASITILTVLLAGTGAIEITCNRSFSIGTLTGALCAAALGWMIQSASEEIAIRGWLIPALGIRYSPAAAVLLTGAVFGAIHLLGSGATALSFLNLTLSGFFFALYAIKTGNIWGVCGLHFGWNLTLANIYGLRVSGAPSIDSALFLANATGADWLTGGAFGPEGGLFTTLLLTGATALLVRNGRGKT